MTAKFEINIIRNLYDNEGGHHMTIRPDVDGLGLVEIDGKGDFGGTICIQPEMALVLADAIRACAEEMIAAALSEEGE
ncbi:hypothetical protein [Ancylobacter polymorphus]|uniref:Uncharacterized protein n=1 Tax=Ancylobacter polymorphus TaxID=223390 RepID=A0ABU0BDA8_9HYPH|nr:hypothetical protein [Ancylobacter polymorphus]MDQ0303815.1 hypothetical protein [Ancylobacter polymorphus]